MDWARDLPTWPHHDLSRRVTLGTHRWHVQETGTGPTLLLLHGAGASTHSWRDLIPLLAGRFHLVALDLPGQGFSQSTARNRCGLQAMTADIEALCRDQGWHPSGIIGHSAGAAIALELSARHDPSGRAAPEVIGINAALSRFEGIAGWLFPLLAKLLALNPLTSLMFTAGRNSAARARRLIEGTGSTLSEDGLGYYARLIADRAHVDGALQMMAQWEIDGLIDRLPQIKTRTLLIAGDRDRAVAPSVSENAAQRLPHADCHVMHGTGHLLHEERPEEVADLILRWLDRADHTRP
ncbi:alpha/beta fold hydrolase [Roseovarius faecimaris]|uniref:Alpha/beta fold hydrolase n=1 Tax=Roseovarius faecimaris TaxID=2494550 RepID=A0A6I6IPK1_9RHOB|nr:alpha/beta fold hydrolase BchO [Roseovarius faecimaris]QGX97741.1 alpha/beta fold hydrolase [Roseovarius faecimaris]